MCSRSVESARRCIDKPSALVFDRDMILHCSFYYLFSVEKKGSLTIDRTEVSLFLRFIAFERCFRPKTETPELRPYLKDLSGNCEGIRFEIHHNSFECPPDPGTSRFSLSPLSNVPSL